MLHTYFIDSEAKIDGENINLSLAKIINKVLHLSTKGIWTLFRIYTTGAYSSKIPSIFLSSEEIQARKQLDQLREVMAKHLDKTILEYDDNLPKESQNFLQCLIGEMSNDQTEYILL